MAKYSLVIHPQTQVELERLLASKPHAVILEAPEGSGKRSVSEWLAAELAEVSDPHKALQQVLFIDRGEDKTVKIEKIRSIEQFLMRKLPGDATRVVIVDDAHTMASEAQNALLKTLEEPPANTSIILLANTVSALLPTVRSRSITITIKHPTPTELKAYFTTQGFAATDVDRAILMSGGLPGLMHAILTSDADHPMMTAAATARQIIQETRFGRLTLVDVLAKQREQAIAVCQMLQRMAHLRLQSDPLAAQWQHILKSSYDAEEQLMASGQPKLVLTSLMLNL